MMLSEYGISGLTSSSQSNSPVRSLALTGFPARERSPHFSRACDHPGTGIRHPLAVALEAVFHIFKIISL